MISPIVSSLLSHSFTSTSKIDFLSEGAIFFEMAAQYELSGNYKKALIWYFHSALRGHTESFNNIGVLRVLGYGHKTVKGNALSWLMLGAYLGDQLARRNLQIVRSQRRLLEPVA